MEQDIKLKGQLRLYMQWPIIMTVVLAAIDVWIFRQDKRAGGVMLLFIVFYFVGAICIYFYGRNTLLSDMIEFSERYGSMQSILLSELPAPYALLMDDGRILWANEEFYHMMGEGIRKDTYIGKYMPELNTGVFPKNDNEVISLEIEYEDRDYQAEVRYISASGFNETEQLVQLPNGKENFIAVHFQDVTDLNHYIAENERQRMVAGLIYIDNYDEVMESVEEVRQSLLVALIDRKINQYVAGLSGIVKKLEKDKYFIVIKKISFQKMVEDKFSLLEEVKSVNIGNEVPVTLSIGLGIGSDSYVTGYNYARVAIDLALARGGDQAVVKTSRGISYHGGKREQTSKNTRVKARVKAEALREFMMTKERVMVMGHKMTDADSFGAAIGIYKAADSLGKKVILSLMI